MCESTCNTLASSVANQGDNTVSVAQGGTATRGATEQLLPLDRVFKRNTLSGSNIHGSHVTANSSTNNNVFFLYFKFENSIL